MTTRTFKYTGKLNSLIFSLKGENFTVFRTTPLVVTDNPELCKLISEHPQIEEVVKADDKPSTRKNGPG